MAQDQRTGQVPGCWQMGRSRVTGKMVNLGNIFFFNRIIDREDNKAGFVSGYQVIKSGLTADMQRAFWKNLVQLATFKREGSLVSRTFNDILGAGEWAITGRVIISRPIKPDFLARYRLIL